MAIAYGAKLGEDMSYGGGFLEGWTTRTFTVASPGAAAGVFVWTPAEGHRASVSNTENLQEPSDIPKGPPFGIYDNHAQQYSVDHPDALTQDFSDAELQGGILETALAAGDTVSAYFAVSALGNTRKSVHGYSFTGLGPNPEVIPKSYPGITVPDNEEWLLLYFRFDADGSNTPPAEDAAWNTLTWHAGTGSIHSHEYLAYKIVSNAAGSVAMPSGADGYMWGLKPAPQFGLGFTSKGVEQATFTHTLAPR